MRMADVVLRVRNTSELDRRYFVVSPYETNELNQFFDLIQIGERCTGLTTAHRVEEGQIQVSMSL